MTEQASETRYSIVVVDDEPTTAQMARSWFKDQPYDILAVSDGESGLDLIRSKHFDLVLLDLGMPGMDGFTVAEELKKDPRTASIPIIFLTANREHKAKMKGFKLPEPFLPRGINHYQEWIRACKGGPKPSTNFDYSGPLTETILLGNVAALAGRKLSWDGPKMRVANMPEANKYLRRKYRKGWTL